MIIACFFFPERKLISSIYHVCPLAPINSLTFYVLLQLKGFEFIKAVHLEPVPFDMDRDLITPTYKKKRPQLLKYYQVLLIQILVILMAYVVYILHACRTFSFCLLGPLNQF